MPRDAHKKQRCTLSLCVIATSFASVVYICICRLLEKHVMTCNEDIHSAERLYPNGVDVQNETTHDADELYPPTAVTFLTRNSERYLVDNLFYVHRELLSRCRDWKIFYVENDSTDRTRAILKSFSRRYVGRVHGEHLSLHVKHSTDLCPRRNLNCLARLELLGSLRSRLVHAALSWKEIELLVMVDIDFFRFDPVSFWKMYTDVLRPLDADGVFGLSKFSPAVGNSCNTQPFGCRVYDYGTVVPQSILDDVTRGWNEKGRALPVRSAFSGLGLYSANALRKYGAEYWKGNYSKELDMIGDDPHNRHSWGLIEHISFNLFLPHLFLYPDFQPEYGGL